MATTTWQSLSRRRHVGRGDSDLLKISAVLRCCPQIGFLSVGVTLIFAAVQFLRGGQVMGGVVSLLGGSGVLATELSSL